MSDTGTIHNSANNGASDFDFFIGEWLIENRKRLKRLQQCEQWETFSARQQAQKLPAGIGNFDDFVAETWRPGFTGMSLRIFNPQTGLWSIFWLTNQDGGIDASTGNLNPPVVGKFCDGVGVFEGTDLFDGKPVRVRYTWSHITANSARWEQAFSQDEGQSWETDWVMEMTRAGS
ncbi:MAG: hypothetical protein RL748_2530 [Pseudomonadota bacterium]